MYVYVTVHECRSAFSSFLPKKNGISFDKRHLIKRLLKEMFKERPSLQKCAVMFDVNKNIKIKNLLVSYYNVPAKWPKITRILASLQTNSIFVNVCRAIFYIYKLTKTWRSNFHQKPLEFLTYPSDKLLCIVRMLKLYLDKKLSLKKKDMCNFFIRAVALYKPFTPKTVLSWELETLGKCGIIQRHF